MLCFIYTDLISCLLDPRPVDPGSTLINVGAHDPKSPFFVLLDYIFMVVIAYIC